jgi:hypothetical protein
MTYEMPDDEAIDNYIDELIVKGVLVLQSVDEYGEPIFGVDIEKAKIHAPEYLEAYYKDIEDTLIGMFEKGIVDFDVSEEGEIEWSLTEKGEEFAQTQIID